MLSLSTQLQAVLNALATPEYDVLSEQYHKIIVTNTEELDSFSQTTKESPEDRAIQAAKAYKVFFGDRVLTPTKSTYDEAKQKNWSTTCWLPAACIVKLINTVEVALALKIVAVMQCKFAIRSAGHNSNPGCSSIGESGILLDLGLLKGIVLSKDQEVASIGPAATWDEVYEELEKHSLTVVGGRASGVGVGGLILGGGMSHFSNHWGMVADNVKNFEVVLANSTIIQTNNKENTDLFQALKGGGPSFGIVTRFDLFTYPEFHVWYKCNVYAATDADQVMKATIAVQKAMEADDRVGLFLSVNAGFFVAGFVYRGQISEMPAAFKAFDNITPISVPVPETHGTQLSVSKAFAITTKAKRETGMVTVGVDADLYVELHKKLQRIVADSSLNLVFTIQPIGKAAVEKGKAYGGNCMNIPAEPQSWLGIMVEWSDDESAPTKIKELTTEIEETARSKGLLLDFQFMNDAGYFQSPLQSYGKDMVTFLQKQSREWDSEGVFQKLQNGGHLLSRLNVDE